MNSRLSLAFLAVLTLSTGCIIGGGPHGQQGQPGNVTFTWTFNGQGCSSVPNVASVQVTIPGQALQNNGVFACETQGYPGITLLSFDPGTYPYTVDALDTAGQVIGTTSSSFIVDGDVQVLANVVMSAPATGDAQLSWTFPANPSSTTPSCAQAAYGGYTVDYLDLYIDGATAPQRLACTAGNGGTAADVSGLAPGNHTFIADAVYAPSSTAQGYALYTYSGSFSIAAGSATPVSVPLAVTLGAIDLGWSLFNGTVAQNCAQAGVTVVWIAFQDTSTNAYLFGASANDISTWAPYSCSDGAEKLVLPPASYKIFMNASANSGTQTAPVPAAPYYGQVAGSQPTMTVTADNCLYTACTGAASGSVTLYRAQ